jgi:uncharacterized protein YjbI with pentapeptide repeats
MGPLFAAVCGRTLPCMRVERKPFGAPVSWWSRPGLLVIAGGGVLLAGGVVWVLGPGAVWVLHHLDGVKGLSGKEEADALDAIRGRALTVATGLLAIVAVYYTARNAHTARRALEHSEESARRTAQLTEQGQVTDRYTKAIEHLGSDKLDVRIGGIYALERIARDSARDHATVIEVLAAFLREHSHDDDANAPATADELERDPDAVGWPRSDLQAALIVIRRRDPRHDSDPIDLSRARLRRSDLARADLTSAYLGHVNLRGAYLAGADLTSARLVRAQLTDARLPDANLANAKLIDADLSRANLTGANLTGADLTRVNLTGADLTGADLDGATLTDAIGWPS